MKRPVDERLVEKTGAARSHLEHVGGLLAPLGHVLRLGQQIVEEARFVELPDELALEAVLHVVDQEVHHGLGNAATQGKEYEETSPRELWRGCTMRSANAV